MGLILLPVVSLLPIDARLLPGLIILVIVISGATISFEYKHALFHKISGGIAILVAVLNVLLSDYGEWRGVFEPILILFMISLTLHLFVRILKQDNVDADMIVNALSVYLLIGINASIAFSYIHALDSEALSFPYSDSQEAFYQYIYFSFVTMTTLGYGDILPTSAASQAVSILLSIFNVFYIGVIIALLIGKFMMENQNKK